MDNGIGVVGVAPGARIWAVKVLSSSGSGYSSQIIAGIERCKGATCTNFALVATVGTNVTSYSNTKLTANTTYRDRIYAYNASGNSGYSNIVTVTTLRR